MAQTFYPALKYEDARGAIDYLVRTFGFRELNSFEADDGSVQHAELEFAGGVVMLGSGPPAGDRFPGGPTTIYVALEDPNSHHDRAVEAEAEVIQELTDQPYGSREYAVRDPEGYVWSFGTYRPEVPG